MELPSSVTDVVDGALDFIYSFGPLVENTVVLGKLDDVKKNVCRY